jgi:hypothetical protein
MSLPLKTGLEHSTPSSQLNSFPASHRSSCLLSLGLALISLAGADLLGNPELALQPRTQVTILPCLEMES